MANKLWYKGFKEDERIDAFTVGNDRELDHELAPYDIKRTMAREAPDKFINAMKRKMLFAAALCGVVSAIMISCGKDNPDTPTPEPEPEPEIPVTPKDTVVYAVGQEAVPGMWIYYATLWKDGKRFLLSDGSYDAFCNGIYADADTIYVVGCEATGDLVDDGYYDPYNQNVGVVWRFIAGEEEKVEKTVISDGKFATSPIAVTVAGGKVYAAGFDTPEYDRRVILWTDGKPEYLTDGSTDALAYCIYADGEDVYVGGYIQPADNKQGGIATIWKNGVAQSLTSGNTVAKVNAICVDGGKVYAAGAEKEAGGRWKGVLWIDGVAQDFTDYAGTEVTGLYVKDGEYIIEGNMTETTSAKDICPYIWTAAGPSKVADTPLCQGVGLAVAGKDIYVAGNEMAGYDSDYNPINLAHLWKNGVEQELEVTYKTDFSVWGVTCAYVEKK